MTAARDAVVGAGIVGLALARALTRRGREVTIFEAGPAAQGASLRNFGTLWPIGQPAGARRRLALASLAIWRQVLDEAGAWSAAHGSLHVAYHDDELAVLRAFATTAAADGFACRWLSPADAMNRCPALRPEGLAGGLWSPHELQINPRQALPLIGSHLEEHGGVRVETATRITGCRGGEVRSGARAWPVDHVWLATGDDAQTLYPDQFAALGLRRCKLQMMRTAPVDWSLGPIVAAGLTLRHYESFAGCVGLAALERRLAADWPRQVAAGVHVLVSQHEAGHLIIGDSHEYDGDVSPFDKPAIDDLITTYMRTFVAADIGPIVERWHGVYLKHPTAPYVVWSPERGVTALGALGGHGMTLAFGLAEQVVGQVLTDTPAGAPAGASRVTARSRLQPR